jgi:hypothetical protein
MLNCRGRYRGERSSTEHDNADLPGDSRVPRRA